MADLNAILSNLVAAVSLTPHTLVAAGLSILASAFLRGFTGFGFALAAVPLLGLCMPASQAVPVAVCLQFFIGMLDLPRAAPHGHWPSLRWLIIGAAIGSPAGALALSIVPASIARLLIATITLAAVVTLNASSRLERLPSRSLTTGVGLLCGLFNGLAAMPGPPVIIYYASGPFGRVAARASLLVFFLVASALAMISTVWVGLLDRNSLLLTLLALPIMLAGTWAGEQAFRRGSDALHRQVSIASLGLIAIGSAIKGVSELM